MSGLAARARPSLRAQGLDLSDYTDGLPNWSHWQFWWD